MKKPECMAAMPALAEAWRKARNLTNTPNDDLHFSDFFAWMKENHPSYLRFRSSTSVSDDVERWFDRYFNQAWRN